MAVIYWPYDPSIINYGFGYPPGYGGFHNGIDFPVPQGTPIKATAAGIIRNVDAGRVDGAGVDIMTSDGIKARHWHVSKFMLPNGSNVNAGDIIALSGGTPGTWGAGNATGAHLHWGIATDGRNNWVDPASLNPQKFDTPTNKGKSKMLMIHKPTGDSRGNLFAIFSTGFWLEFTGQDAANGFAKQIGASSVLVSEAFWTYCKKASQAPVNVSGGGSGTPTDPKIIALAVNDEMAKRMQS